MATLTNAPSRWAHHHTERTSYNLWHKWLAFTNSQAKHKMFWFLVSLISQGIFFLPLPAILTFYYNAPVYLLLITLPLFFATVIAGMGGAGIRAIMSLFALSIFVHLCMMLIYVLHIF